jgi:hypothetical protein
MSWLSRQSSLVLPVPFLLSCVLAVLFWLSCSAFSVLPVLFCLSCPGCPVLAVYRRTITKLRARKSRSTNVRARKIKECVARRR